MCLSVCPTLCENADARNLGQMTLFLVTQLCKRSCPLVFVSPSIGQLVCITGLFLLLRVTIALLLLPKCFVNRLIDCPRSPTCNLLAVSPSILMYSAYTVDLV